ncbi:uncharacterized protein N7484_008640 [Penicillium longicatenatum]|uniref:uncharacterized protein n=1 Tax=Penicillium longicatenatum TaxID=1561947 RepID=UPI002547304F|nr:uncharacterized protein N7484_008640 [Penicillium longicatenatum]KAJ5635327.1 hypothetical protein N7484_008640 [Penicillium longicatenatum]
MASSRAGIQALPPEVAAKIKSSISITDLNGVILELVKNALDANASTVHISVDFKRGGCIVEDDGDGIRSIEFESTGGLGKAHHTSQFQQTAKYGHRGLFLSALSALSLLTVTSCHIHQQTTNSVIFHRSTPVARLIPSPVHQSLRFSDHGTCVTVNDLFGNMPVRVKRRALAFERPDELDREWDNLRYSLASLMLANPLLLKLVLSDTERGKRVSIRLDRSIPGDHVDVANTIDLRRIGSILAQSGMINTRNMDTWHIISASIPDLAICAAISIVPSPSKKLQFVSLGNDPVLPNGSNILFKEINRLISLSDFGVSGNISRNTATCPSPVLGHSEAPSSLSGKAWAKPVNKWPMFYIRIETSTTLLLGDDGDEVSPNSDKSLQRVTDLLEAMILEFLKQQNLRPRITKRQEKISNRAQGGPSVSQSRSRSSSKQRGAESSAEEGFSNNLKLPSFQRPQSVNSSPNLNNWSRVKTAKGLDTRLAPDRDSANRLEGQIFSLPERPQSRSKGEENVESLLSNTSLEHSKEVEQDDDEDKSQTTDRLIPWVNQRTGKTHMINSRTGQTVGPMASSSFTRPTLPRLGDTQSNPSIPKSWVENLLKAWDNPTLTRTEMPLPRLDLENNYFNPEASSRSCLYEIGTLETSRVASFRGKLQRQSLSKATIIAQVDQKFILAKLDAGTLQSAGIQDAVLVLIDQHAADERCRIEQLFEEMFIPAEPPYETKVRTVEIKPIAFKISSTEATLFHKYSGFFQDWGIHYNTGETSESEPTILVHLLPALIAERCRLEPTLIVELLRREIWTNEEGSRKPLGAVMASADNHSESHGMSFDEDESSPVGSSTPHSWVQKMSGCPQGIIDLLNSRACRTAIMFNDPLGIDECRKLILRLARCAFPFQCAHGRPSMIPILDLRPQPTYETDKFDGGMGLEYDDYDDSGMNFIEAFQAKYVH